jgi:hypothetical protein
MFKQISIVMVLGISFALSGCATDTGNVKLAKTSNETINSTFIKGKTTQEEVKKVFGKPSDTDIMIDGKVKWTFAHVKRSEMVRNYIPVVNWSSQGTDDTTRKLVMVFKDGILEDYSSRQEKLPKLANYFLDVADNFKGAMKDAVTAGAQMVGCE